MSSSSTSSLVEISQEIEPHWTAQLSPVEASPRRRLSVADAAEGVSSSPPPSPSRLSISSNYRKAADNALQFCKVPFRVLTVLEHVKSGGASCDLPVGQLASVNTASDTDGDAGLAQRRFSRFSESCMSSSDSPSGSTLPDGREPLLDWFKQLYRRLSLLLLLLPKSQKNPMWMETLRLDQPTFLADTIVRRIVFARTLTVVWLLVTTVVSMVDYLLDALSVNPRRHGTTILFRGVGSVVSLSYVLLLGSHRAVTDRAGAEWNAASVLRWVRIVTLFMLVTQLLSLFALSFTIYNGEVSMIAISLAYVLFYTVFPLSLRLVLCALMVIGYVLSEYGRCGQDRGRYAWQNIGFLLVFVAYMACGVRLGEHLEHAAHYEQRRVGKRLQEFKEAQAAGSALLLNLLPAHVVDHVGEGISPIAEHIQDVTILFTDIKGFTAYSARMPPADLVDFLNMMYSAFDEIIANWALHKVEIIGDAYFISAGCPEPPKSENSPKPDEYAMRAVEVGLALLRALPRVCDDESVQMRVGLHTGSVVAGVVGKKGPRYHLFGSAVGYAENMEKHGIPGRVHISDTTHQWLIAGGHDYSCEERSIEVEGEKGLQRTWLVNKGHAKTALRIQKKLMMSRRRSLS